MTSVLAYFKDLLYELLPVPYTWKLVYKLLKKSHRIKPLPTSTCVLQTITQQKILTTHLLSLSLQPTANFIHQPNRNPSITPHHPATANHITVSATNHSRDQSITTFVWISSRHLTLKLASAQDVEKSVTTNSPSQDSFHLDDQIPSRKQIYDKWSKKRTTKESTFIEKDQRLKKIWDLINKRKCLIHWNLLGYLWHWCHQSVLPWRYIGDFGQKSAYFRTSFRITVPLKERNRKITGPSGGKRSCFRPLSKNVAGNCCRRRRSVAVHHQNMCF